MLPILAIALIKHSGFANKFTLFVLSVGIFFRFLLISKNEGIDGFAV